MTNPDPLITLFAAPKPFAGQNRSPQRLALESWLRLAPECEVLLVGDAKGVRDAARAYGVGHLSGVACNTFGTPLVSSIFQAAENASRSRILCYVNSDILLTSDFVCAVRSVPFDRFLVVGQRWDVDPDYMPSLDRTDWEGELRRRVRALGRLQLPNALDYFVFTRGLWPEIPPLALGRTVWDDWLVYAARANGAQVVDATASVLAVHQNHDYSHHAGGTQGVWKGAEAKRNYALAGGEANLLYAFDADWTLADGKIRRPPVARRASRRIFANAWIHPRSLLLFRIVYALDFTRRRLVDRGQYVKAQLGTAKRDPG